MWVASALTESLCLRSSVKWGGVDDVWEGLGDQWGGPGQEGEFPWELPPLWLVIFVSQETTELFWSPQVPLTQAELWSSLTFLLFQLPDPHQPTDLADLWSVWLDQYHPIPHSVLFRLFGVFLSNISFIIQSVLALGWTGHTDQRKWLFWGWFQTTFYPRGTQTCLFCVCLLCSISPSFRRSSWQTEGPIPTVN